jgi:hypothetical protein
MKNRLNAFEKPASIFLFFSFSAGIMVSPDTLAMVGQFFGQTGGYGFFLIGLAAVIYLFLNSQYTVLNALEKRTKTDFQTIGYTTESLFSSILIGIKITAVLFLSTGLLVSAGFVFNEIFIYWFPNFGFAFILLGILIAVQFLSDRYINGLQILLVSISITGIVLIIFAGLAISPGHEIVNGSSLTSIKPLNAGTIVIPFLFFIGLDMGYTAAGPKPPILKSHLLRGLFTIAIMTLIFIFWGQIALDHVPLKKLSQTAISHIVISRHIIGETGRYIIGMVVISGTLAALNSLFTCIKKQVQLWITIRSQNQISNNRSEKTAQILVAAIAIIIGILMAGGLAGDEILEALITGALILWLLSYALIPVLNLFLKKHVWAQPLQLKNRQFIVPIIISFLPMAISVLILIFKHESPKVIIVLMTLAVTISIMIERVSGYMIKKSGNLS